MIVPFAPILPAGGVAELQYQLIEPPVGTVPAASTAPPDAGDRTSVGADGIFAV